MKRPAPHKVTGSFILVLLLLFCAEPALAQSGFSFYFFGQNIKSFQDGNWMEAAAGAFASICIHELGHALYLESRGKSWHLNATISSGFAIRTDEILTDSEMRNFGRAGFALQSLIGTGLTLFQQTRDLDFTKGWVTMNAVQVVSYQSRRHGNDDDFALIERGGGKSDLEFAAFSVLSVNNWIQLKKASMILASKSDAAPDFNLYSIVKSSSLRSDTNICPGAWVITRGSGTEVAANCEVTPQAQKTGISSGRMLTASPKSGFVRSEIPIFAGSPK